MPTAFTVVGLAILVSLGVWQVRRMGEASAREAEFAARLAEPPFDAAAPPADAGDRRGRVTGTPRWDRHFLLAGKYMWSQVGYDLLVPVELDGGAVIVDLGWVPAEEAEAVVARERAVAAPRTFEGLARVYPEDGDARGTFAPEDGYQRRWRAPAPRAMGEQAGLVVTPWILVAGEPLGASETPKDREPPIGGWRAELPKRPHGEYALTWFSIAAVLLGVWLSASFQPAPRDA